MRRSSGERDYFPPRAEGPRNPRGYDRYDRERDLLRETRENRPIEPIKIDREKVIFIILITIIEEEGQTRRSTIELDFSLFQDLAKSKIRTLLFCIKFKILFYVFS
jgi:hypothetical protein